MINNVENNDLFVDKSTLNDVQWKTQKKKQKKRNRRLRFPMKNNPLKLFMENAQVNNTRNGNQLANISMLCSADLFPRLVQS